MYNILNQYHFVLENRNPVLGISTLMNSHILSCKYNAAFMGRVPLGSTHCRRPCGMKRHEGLNFPCHMHLQIKLKVGHNEAVPKG